MDDRYAAGLLDGEGCVQLSKQQFKTYIRYQLRVQMRMTNPAPLVELQKEYGGSLCLGTPPKNPKHRPTLTWTIVSREAADFLRRVRPWLIVKAEESDLALEFQDGIPQGQRIGKSRGLDAAEWARRERIRIELLKAKHRPLDPANLAMATNSGNGQNGRPRAKQEPQAPGVCND
jgi:hypothetical protein